MLERLQQPGGMREPGLRGEYGALDAVAPGGEAPQGRVHESGRPRLAEGPGQLDGRVHRRVRRYAGECELVEPEEGEGADVGVAPARRALRDVRQPGVQAREVAQGAERELPGERPLARVEVRAGAPRPARPEGAAVPEHADEHGVGDLPRCPARGVGPGVVACLWPAPDGVRSGRCVLSPGTAVHGGAGPRPAPEDVATARLVPLHRNAMHDARVSGRRPLIAVRTRSVCRARGAAPGRIPRPSCGDRRAAGSR